ncbi:hypothetical protein GLOTRDRAFT_129685 [Gloeophyllum trabeum ATCC 11539]|uniref:Uncharacterized protein n=1 Tax=Gloeophyllum trabeum (strain ATCC 11539 / FP-39264 / Madison 617) TaxID=670483 RepID=S7Q5S2_GLOTA|nr:uncharacterized protein GLOTRDRAFT_129685 [Gloeophyllum trabeum ATCC 11539]EPQ55411.1 hypothetical protein GLOTRDRAFT_129685 [Gloeophyllum trabeum ATCC 11539]
MEAAQRAPAASAVVHHERYYFPAGTVVIKVGHVLYRPHRDILDSEVFHHMFSMPPGDSGAEGLDDVRPITLAFVTTRQFEDFLDFVYRPWSPPPYSVDSLINLYELGKMWLMDDAMAFARSQLDSMTLHPARRLQVARLLRVEAWLAPAFRQLVTMPLRDLTLEHGRQIGLETYQILTKAKDGIERERRLAAAKPPMLDVQDVECEDHRRCQSNWNVLWKRKVGAALLHPDTPLAFAQVLDHVQSVEWVDVFTGCRDGAIEKLEANGFVRDNEIIQQAVSLLSPYYQSDDSGFRGPRI